MGERVDVAVAVIFNQQGQVLWGSRPSGKPYAGYWEFPGGKLEEGESVWQALVREIKEELGILVTQGGPWFVIDHDYEHAKVRLHLYRVWGFEGQPQSLEGQAFIWSGLHSNEVSPVLPATEPLLPILNQPAVLALTDFASVGIEPMLQLLDRAKERTSGKLQVCFREKNLDLDHLRKAFSFCHSWCRSNGITLVVNSDSVLQMLSDGCCVLPPDVSLHLTQAHLLDFPQAFHSMSVSGVSVHNAELLEKAFLQGAQYALCGSVKPTATHPEATPLGWNGFKHLVSETKLPVYAIGGLGWDDLPLAQQNGAHGIAMISGLAKA
jgi:8-oxo-dGTP diphosphatase